MPLNLSEASSGRTGFVGDLSIDHLSFWFWVKAGIGFTFGAGLVSMAGILVWVFVVLPFYVRLMFRGIH